MHISTELEGRDELFSALFNRVEIFPISIASLDLDKIRLHFRTIKMLLTFITLHFLLDYFAITLY